MFGNVSGYSPAVLAIIRFNLLIPALLAATLLFADQMIDILRAVGEDERRASVAWLLAMCAFLRDWWVWYIARAPCCGFRFLPPTPASDPKVASPIKSVFCRAYSGCRFPACSRSKSSSWPAPAARSARGGCGCSPRQLGHHHRVWWGSMYFKRRRIAEETGFTALASLRIERETRSRPMARVARHLSPRADRFARPQCRRAVALHVGTVFMPSVVPWPLGGAPRFLLLGLGLTTRGPAAIVVYIANHHGIPDHFAVGAVDLGVQSGERQTTWPAVVPDGTSHGFLWRAPIRPRLRRSSRRISPLGDQSLDEYFKAWFKDLAGRQPIKARPIPVFIVFRRRRRTGARAYWDRHGPWRSWKDDTANNPLPFFPGT